MNNAKTLNEFIDRLSTDTKDILNSYRGLVISNLSLTNLKRNIEKPYNDKYYIEAFSDKYSIKLLLHKSVLSEAIKINHKINETVCVDVTIDFVTFQKSGNILISVSKIVETGIGEQEIFERNLDIFCKRNLIYERPKKQLPSIIKKIALISTIGTNTVDDIKNNLIYTKELDVFTVNGSSNEIAKKILECQNVDYDVILLFRGGHQDKAMNIYSDIPVIKAIVDSKIHVGAALGHETDFPFIYKIVDSYYSTPTNFAQVANEHNNNQIIQFDSNIVNIKYYIYSLLKTLENNCSLIKIDNFEHILKHLSADLELIENKINKEVLTIIHKNEKALDNGFYKSNTTITNKINQVEKILNFSIFNINENTKNNIQLLSNNLNSIVDNIKNKYDSTLTNLQVKLDKNILNIENLSNKLISEIRVKTTKKKYITIIFFLAIFLFIAIFVYFIFG